MWWVLVPCTSGLFSSTAAYFYMVPSLKNRINFWIASVRIYQILSAYPSEFSDLKFALRYAVHFLKESQFLVCLYIKNTVVLLCTYFVEVFGGALEMYCFFLCPLISNFSWSLLHCFRVRLGHRQQRDVKLSLNSIQTWRHNIYHILALSLSFWNGTL